MSHYYSYLNTSASIIDQYRGEVPLSSFLKKFFAGNKKYGSRDRKQIAHLCYCYFRMGKMALQLPVEERILAGLFLCSDEPDELLKKLKPEWNEKTGLDIEAKCSVLSQDYSGAEFFLDEVFPFENYLSEGISFKGFSRFFFTQPDLFLRIRPGHAKDVLQKLQDSNLQFRVIGKDCIALSNTTKVENVLSINKEVIIQDYNSQLVAEFLPVRPGGQTGRYLVWDCCAASGGKSILVNDVMAGAMITVSDIRKNILANLKKRFEEAGIKHYQSFVADIAYDLPPVAHNFDLIIADVPCSGSGTWGRTPEQLYHFQVSEIEKYSSLQKSIVDNVIRALKPGGYFLYSTCSVFKKENENLVDFIRDKSSMILIRKEVLKGYDKKADTMFAALFQKPL
jgi:16S rRNA (cytosine967-C5)-methyltransferase